MADVLRDVIIRIGIEQKDQRLKAPDISDAKRSTEEFTSTVEAGVKELTSALNTSEQAIDDFEDKLTSSKGSARDFATEMSDAKLKAGEAMKATGEGAFTLARGIAFLSASSEKEMQKMVQNIAMVQGGFDVFKGSIETIKGVVEATRALTLTTEIYTAKTAADTVVTEINTAATVAQTAAKSSLVKTLTGPVGIVVGLGLAAAAYLVLTSNKQNNIETTYAEIQANADLAAGILTVEQQATDQLRRLKDTETQRRELISLTGEQAPTAAKAAERALGPAPSWEDEPRGDEIIIRGAETEVFRRRQAEAREQDEMEHAENMLAYAERQINLQNELASVSRRRLQEEQERIRQAEQAGEISPERAEFLTADVNRRMGGMLEIIVANQERTIKTLEEAKIRLLELEHVNSRAED